MKPIKPELGVFGKRLCRPSQTVQLAIIIIAGLAISLLLYNFAIKVEIAEIKSESLDPVGNPVAGSQQYPGRDITGSGLDAKGGENLIPFEREVTPFMLLALGLITTMIFVCFTVSNFRAQAQTRQLVLSQIAAGKTLTREVSERKHTEEKLGLMQRIVEQAHDCIAVADSKGYLKYCNPPWAKMHGYEVPEIVGKHLSCLHTKEQMLNGVIPFNEQVIKDGICSGEIWHKRKDGATFATLMTSTTMKDEDGKIIGIIGVARDLTGQKRLERELEAIIDSAPVGIMLVDCETREITKINQNALDMSGSLREDILGSTCNNLWQHPDGHKCPILDIGKRSDCREKLIMRDDGTQTQVLKSAAKITAGDREYLMETFIDISERKRAEEVLQEANKTLEEMNARLKENRNQLVQSEKMASIGQLAAGVAHEINNPVGFVRSNIGTLTGYVKTFKELFQQYDQLTDAVINGDVSAANSSLESISEFSKKEDLPYILKDIDELLAESLEGTERVKEIVQNLKSFARADTNEIKEADINEGIEATIKIVWNELKYKCTVHKDLKPLPPIPCNLVQLNQVFMNILVNAAHAIPEKGEINIETSAQDGHIEVRISDTGVGIPAENIPKLFDPFFTTKPVGKGTGLGLSISHGIIQKHNGTIDAESEVGKGTTFIIRLPVEGVKDER